MSVNDDWCGIICLFGSKTWNSVKKKKKKNKKTNVKFEKTFEQFVVCIVIRKYFRHKMTGLSIVIS